MPLKMPSAAGMRQAKLLELGGDFGGEDRAGRGAVDDDVLRLVGLEQLLVDGYRVVHGGGEGMLGSQAVEHRNDLDLRVAGDGNRLGVGAGVGVEAAAVQIEQHLVAVGLGHAVGGDDANRNAGDLVFDELVGAELAPGRGSGYGPGVGAAAAVGQ